MSASSHLQLLFTAIHSCRQAWAFQNSEHLKKNIYIYIIYIYTHIHTHTHTYTYIFQVVPSDSCAKEGLSGYPMAAATGKHTQTALSPVSLFRVNQNQVLLPCPSEQSFHRVLAGQTCTALTWSTLGVGFSAWFSRLSEYLSQTEASLSHGPFIPML